MTKNIGLHLAVMLLMCNFISDVQPMEKDDGGICPSYVLEEEESSSVPNSVMSTLKKNLLKNPEFILQECLTLQKNFREELEKRLHLEEESVQEEGESTSSCSNPTTKFLERTRLYEDLVKSYEERFPIFLLRECTLDRGGICALRRIDHLKKNNKFEKEASAALAKKLRKANWVTLFKYGKGAVNYTDFGSGDLFSPLIIALRALSILPRDVHPSLNINLIDKENAAYVRVLDALKLKSRHDVLLQQSNKWVTTIVSLSLDSSNKDSYSKQGGESIEATYNASVNKYQQFLRCLTTNFPDANIIVTVHATVKEYLEYTKEDITIAPPTVITARDIDDLSCDEETNTAYSSLCEDAAQYPKLKPKNFLLARDKKGKIRLIKDYKKFNQK